MFGATPLPSLGSATLLFVLGGALLLLVWRYLFRRLLFRNVSSIKQRAVVVTGCDSGFGRMIALRLHDLGATVYAGCISRSSCDELNRSDRKRMHAFICDVTKDDDVAKCAMRVEKSGHVVCALINNAGVSAFGWAEALDIKTYQRNMDVNFFGTVRMTRAFLPLLRKHRGRLINMGSIGARMPSAFGSAYLSTKAAMCSYSDCVRQEMHRFGVHVALIEPGFQNRTASGRRCGWCWFILRSRTEIEQLLPSHADKMSRTAEPFVR